MQNDAVGTGRDVGGGVVVSEQFTQELLHDDGTLRVEPTTRQ